MRGRESERVSESKVGSFSTERLGLASLQLVSISVRDIVFSLSVFHDTSNEIENFFGDASETTHTVLFNCRGLSQCALQDSKSLG